MALAPNALTTVARLQAAGAAGDSARLEQLINAVSNRVEEHLGRALGYQVRTLEPYQGSGVQRLYLQHWPILEVTEVRLNEVEVTDWRLLINGARHGWLYRSRGWPIAAPRDWTGDPDLDAELYPFEVSYRAGYVLPQFATSEDEDLNPPDGIALPRDIEEAVIQACLVQESRPAAVGAGLMSERTPGGWEQQWSAGEASRRAVLPQQTLELLASYERITLL